MEWTGQDTKLARILSIANNFDAEIEFETQLHNNHTFKAFIVNVYKEYEEGVSYGVGRDRSDIVLRYQKNVTGITKKIRQAPDLQRHTPVWQKDSQRRARYF